MEVLQFKSFNDYMNGPTEIEWTVDKFVPSVGTVNILAADGGTGKTWCLLDLVISMAKNGLKWLNKFDVQHGPIWMFEREDSDVLIRKHLYMLLNGRGLNIDDLDYPITIDHDLDVDFSPLFNADGKRSFKPQITKLIQTIRQTEIKPKLIIFDSLIRIHSGLNENDATDMKLVSERMRTFATLLNIPILVSHHSTKDGKTFRGSSEILNGADNLMNLKKVENVEDKTVDFVHTKARWGREIAPFNLKYVFDDFDTQCVLQYDGIKVLNVPSKWEMIVNHLVDKNNEWTSKSELLEIENMCKETQLRNILNAHDNNLESTNLKGHGHNKFYRLKDEFYDSYGAVMPKIDRVNLFDFSELAV